MTTNVLILCTHNSARSVLAEGMLNHWAQRFEATRRSMSDRMMQLLELPFDRMSDFDLEQALVDIAKA